MPVAVVGEVRVIRGVTVVHRRDALEGQSTIGTKLSTPM